MGRAGRVSTSTAPTTTTRCAPDDLAARPTSASATPTSSASTRRLGTLDTSENGWLANVTLRKDAGLTRYVGRFAVDVQPSSSVGSQVETQELIGEVFRRIDPLIDLSFRARAYEPDRLGARPGRRVRAPLRQLRAARDLALRARLDRERVLPLPSPEEPARRPESAESNALLFSIRWAPPSRVGALDGGG